MLSGTQARADWRALISAAFIGSGVGLSLGAAYLMGGLGQAVAEHGRAERIAEATRGALPDSALRPALAPPAKAAAPGAAPRDPQLARVETPPSRAQELDCLTQAVYFEARGESARGQAAVATVIMNRVKNPSFPKTVCGVVYQGASHRNGCQFSFACDGAAERVVENSAWDRARQVAARALSGVVLRDVGKATHFHTTGVSPDWGPQMLRVAQVGLHVFYRFNPHAPRAVARDADDADDAPVFTAAAATPAQQQQQLRLAAAVVAPAPAEPAVQPQPAPKVEPPRTSGPIARTDTAAPPKAATAPS